MLVVLQFFLLLCLALLFSFWKQHLFWEINVTLNTSRILSEVPKNCPVYLVPDQRSCITHKAWLSPTDRVIPTVLRHTLKQTDPLWWCWMCASQFIQGVEGSALDSNSCHCIAPVHQPNTAAVSLARTVLHSTRSPVYHPTTFSHYSVQKDAELTNFLLSLLIIRPQIPSGRAVWGVDLRPLACWDCGFESSRKPRFLFVVSVVCCQ